MPKYIGYNFTGTANSSVVTSALNGGVTDYKYNSGIWSISDSSGEEYSVFTRIKQENWPTALVAAPVDNFTVLAVNLTTDASDASGYSPAHTITVSGDTSFGATGANFDGSGDKIRYVGNGGDPFNIAGNEDFVIQFELDVDETGPAGPFDTGINVGGIGAFTNGGSSTATKYFRIIGGADISVATTWNGTWRIERSGSTITLYKDDVSQGTATYSGAISSAASGSAITLGSHDLNSTYPTYYELDGRIRYFQFRKGTTTVLSAPF